GRTGSNMSYSTTLKLAAHKNICGIKEASGNVEQAMMIAAGMPKDFLLISGDDIITTALYSIGASGVISVLANAYPQIFNKMKTYAFAGNYSKASKEAFKLLEINPLMYQEGNPAGIKHVLQEMGICKDYVREPLAMVSKSLAKNIEAAHAAVIKKG
ncbi:MAG TPA: dihydrodipicolinate synthase family protein, partial [Cyclobacteriaceae bacterium]|nr:dihydrodipicolinate synthase family protein [Cyclobacteriaceae bacterium]